MATRRRQVVSFVVLFILGLSLPLLLVGFDQVKNYLSRATAKPANIVVDTTFILGPLPQSWRAIAQGGEDQGRTFLQVRDELQELSPKYIRLDHIYDFYNIVKRENGQLVFDFSELDQIVRDILASGSSPFFALSYMPSIMSSDGTVVGRPINWADWSLLVRNTIEHYSGRNNMNIQNVYYEIWNEPDLFGQWKTYGDKNYLDLYYFAVKGADKSENTNNFFIGGPATTAVYQNWFMNLLKFVKEKNLRLDFLSWHRYSIDTREYRKDIDLVNSWISSFPDFQSLPKVISEFGFDSENNPAYDTNLAAAHTAAVIRSIIPDVELAFTFELKDGLSPKGEKYWGRWGILTHDQFNNEKKPRYFVLKLLNQLSGRRIGVSGEGDYVSAIASLEFDKVQILLINYDKQNTHAESVPVKITNLANSSYKLSYEDISGNKTNTVKLVEDKAIEHKVIMPPNSVVLLTLSPI